MKQTHNANLASAYAHAREAQEKLIAQDPLMRRFAASRRALASDRYRPIYHFVSPESNLNDPNGLCFWQGQWHLFYQGYPPENLIPHWGHAVSDDLIHWRDLPYAINPGPEEACWSGSTWVEDDRVIAMYHGHKLGNMVAVANDPLLLNWEKVTGTTVIPNPCPIWTHTKGGESMRGVGGNPVPANAINFVYIHVFGKKAIFTTRLLAARCRTCPVVGARGRSFSFDHPIWRRGNICTHLSKTMSMAWSETMAAAPTFGRLATVTFCSTLAT